MEFKRDENGDWWVRVLDGEWQSISEHDMHTLIDQFGL